MRANAFYRAGRNDHLRVTLNFPNTGLNRWIESYQHWADLFQSEFANDPKTANSEVNPPWHISG
jgi:hypothetical protein